MMAIILFVFLISIMVLLMFVLPKIIQKRKIVQEKQSPKKTGTHTNRLQIHSEVLEGLF
jgi:membrane-anchored glycerophosphoryl diester phosphodiesterase (GDPDase)